MREQEKKGYSVLIVCLLFSICSSALLPPSICCLASISCLRRRPNDLPGWMYESNLKGAGVLLNLAILACSTRCLPSRSRHCQSSLGRIHDGKAGGVLLLKGANGRMEGCQIWGNAEDGVSVQDDGSEAVLVGCKCAGGREGFFSWGLAYFRFSEAARTMPFLLPPLLNIAWQDQRWKRRRDVSCPRWQSAGGGQRDLRQ